MRGLGFALILFGILSAVIILLYGPIIGWSGLVGSVAAVMCGVGFLFIEGDSCRNRNQCRNYCGN